MGEMIGKQSVKFAEAPYIFEGASVVGPKEGEGPLGKLFDVIEQDPMLACLGSGFRIDVHDHRFPAHLHKLLGNRFANTLRCASNNASLAGERNVVQIHLEAPS